MTKIKQEKSIVMFFTDQVEKKINQVCVLLAADSSITRTHPYNGPPFNFQEKGKN